MLVRIDNVSALRYRGEREHHREVMTMLVRIGNVPALRHHGEREHHQEVTT